MQIEEEMETETKRMKRWSNPLFVREMHIFKKKNKVFQQYV